MRNTVPERTTTTSGVATSVAPAGRLVTAWRGRQKLQILCASTHVGPECTSGPRPMSRNAGPRAETRFAPIRRGVAGGIENGEFPTIRTSIKCSDGPAPTAPRVVFAPSPMSFETKVDHSVQSRGMTMADSGVAAPASRPREHGLSAQTGISFSYGS